MLSMIDVFFLVAFLTNLVKGGDLFLREHQKKAVQDFCEIITIRLDDIRPLRWLGSIATPRAQKWLSGIATFQLLAVALLVYFAFSPTSNDRVTITSWLLIAVGINIAAFYIIPRQFLARPIAWMLSDPHLLTIIRKFSIVQGSGIIAIGVYLVLLGIIIGIITGVRFHIGSMSIRVMFYGLLPFSPLITYFLIVLQATWLAVLMWVAIGILELAMKAMRGFAWRVVEYVKGAWAALLLAIMAILGIASLLKGR